MLNDKKLKKLREHFALKRDGEKKQLATTGEQFAVASFQESNVLRVAKNLTKYQMSEAAHTSLKNKSAKSGVPFPVLKEVYKRGVDAWKLDDSRTAQQAGFARVNSFIARGQAFTEDYDIVQRLLEETPKKMKPPLEGTNEIVRRYKKGTPGENNGKR